jgi:hypothetical protein
MKRRTGLTLLFVTGVLIVGPAWASVVEDYSYAPALAIPDNTPAGVSDVQMVSGSQITNIEDLNVDIFVQAVSGGWNGDIYATLTHSSGFSVLMNRVGRRAASTVGYSDDGMDVILDDQAPDINSLPADIHRYRFVLFGNDTTTLPTGVPLGQGGTPNLWQPDARNTPPSSVLDTDPRTAFLSAFNGLDANGTWTLFVSDNAAGDTHRLATWSLHITGTPEPASLILLGLAGLLIRRR